MSEEEVESGGEESEEENGGEESEEEEEEEKTEIAEKKGVRKLQKGSEDDDGEEEDDGDKEDGEEGESEEDEASEEEEVVERKVAGKLTKEGLNDVLIKLRRPITQAKVSPTLPLHFSSPFKFLFLLLAHFLFARCNV